MYVRKFRSHVAALLEVVAVYKYVHVYETHVHVQIKQKLASRGWAGYLEVERDFALSNLRCQNQNEFSQ